MARGPAADHGAKRRAILDHAADLFAEKGFRGAGMSDLARRCGVSKSALFHYFPTKEAILHAVLAGHVADLAAAADGALSASGRSDPALALRALTRAIMALYAGARSRHVLLLNALVHLPAAARGEIVAAERRLVQRVEALITRVAPAAMADPAARRPTAMLYFGMLNWTHTWYRPDGPLAPEALADRAVALFLDGLHGAGGAPASRRPPGPPSPIPRPA